MSDFEERLSRVRTELDQVARGRRVRLLAVSKQQPVAAIRTAAQAGMLAFGENYVQEARAKQHELADLELQWHLIGPLQSNKCRDAAQHFDWVQSVDRDKLVPLLARQRPAQSPPLNLLIQVNIDDEASKSGCSPDAVAAIALAISLEPRLRLRGLMAIPAPTPVPEDRRGAFRRMRTLFETLQREHHQVDTLSMGMSDDYAIAVAEGANLVRIGSALFGPRERSA